MPSLESKLFCMVLKAYSKNKVMTPALQCAFDSYLSDNQKNIKVYDYVQIFIQYSKSSVISREFIQAVEQKVVRVFEANQKVTQ